MMCHKSKQLFYFLPVDFLTDLAKWIAERARIRDMIDSRIGGNKYIMKAVEPSIGWFNNSYRNPSTTIVSIVIPTSIIKKILLTLFVLYLSTFISLSMAIFFCTKSLNWDVLSYLFSMTVRCRSNSRRAFLTIPEVRKQVFMYYEAYIQWHIGPSIFRSV